MRRFIVVTILLLGHVAMASPIQLDVGGDACVTSTLEASVVELVGAEPLPKTTRVRIELLREPAGVAAHLWFPDRAGNRRGLRVVQAATCAKLLPAIALVIAMALPEVSVEAEPPVETPPPAPPITVAPSITGVVATARPAMRTRFAVYASGGSVVSANGTLGQVLVGTRARRGARSLGLQLRIDAPDTREVTAMAGIRVLRTELSASPCLHRGAIAGCAVASVGILAGTGDGLAGSRSAMAPVVSTGVRLAWEHVLTRRLALRVHVEADAILTSTQFEVDFMPVWKTAGFEGSGGVGMIAHFP